MAKTPASCLYACGKSGPEQQITLDNHTYRLTKTFKHDFFAATALYTLSEQNKTNTNLPPKIVLKVSRTQPIAFIPMAWLGKMLCSHEMKMIRKLEHLKITPKIIQPYKKTGFIYRYIEGVTLDEKPELPPDFFKNLKQLVKKMHSLGIVYIDMNKRGNIILTSKSTPLMIDFQLALSIKPLWLRKLFIKEDLYHLLKHQKKLAFDSLTPQQLALTRNPSPLIRAHRLIANPFRKIRRTILRALYINGKLITDESAKTPENDPARFA